MTNKALAINYMNVKDRVYVIEGYAGYHPKYRKRIRFYLTRPYHAIFCKNMFVRPTEEEFIKDFMGEVDFNVFNSGELAAPVVAGTFFEKAGLNPKT